MNRETGPGPRRAGGEEDVREFRLEGLGLAVVGAVLLAALSGAFYLGRWYESRDRTEGASSAAVPSLPGSDAETRTKVVSADEGVTAFDTVGGGTVAEPRREARPPATAPPTVDAAAGTDARTQAAPAVAGPWTIQVAAVRERRSAEQLYGELRDKGFEARIDSARDGSDTVFKVRVGGFSDKDAAGPTAERLQAAGYAPWVTRVD